MICIQDLLGENTSKGEVYPPPQCHVAAKRRHLPLCMREDSSASLRNDIVMKMVTP